MLSGQAIKHDVMMPNLNFAMSLKCSWFSNTLSGFSGLVSCVIMPLCSARCCSNQSNKDPEKRFSFHNLSVRKKKSEQKWLDQLCRDACFMTKKTCYEHFTEDCYEVTYRYEMLGVKTRKRRLNQGAVPKVFQSKVPLKPHLTNRQILCL